MPLYTESWCPPFVNALIVWLTFLTFSSIPLFLKTDTVEPVSIRIASSPYSLTSGSSTIPLDLLPFQLHYDCCYHCSMSLLHLGDSHVISACLLRIVAGIHWHNAPFAYNRNRSLLWAHLQRYHLYITCHGSVLRSLDYIWGFTWLIACRWFFSPSAPFSATFAVMLQQFESLRHILWVYIIFINENI